MMVLSFLQWDIYCACASLNIWAVYHLHRVQESSKLILTVCKVVFWMALGGPVTPVVMLLWGRDNKVLERLDRLETEGKRK